jgi:hypothetical protein
MTSVNVTTRHPNTYLTTANDYVVTLLSINVASSVSVVIVVNADRATTANDYVVTTTRKNGATIVGKTDIPTNTRDYVVTLSGLEFIEVALIVITIVRDAYLANASDYVVTITSIEVARGIETGIIFVSATVSSASDYVITIAGIYRSSVGYTVTNSSGSIPIYYVVTITSINAAAVDNAMRKRGVLCLVMDTRDSIVTLGSIEDARVENARSTSIANASDSVVASKSISDASIDEYFFHPRRRNNIILVSKG